jgi:chromosome segregation ATPase
VTAFTQKKAYTDGTSGEWTYLRCWNPKNLEQIMYVKEEKLLKEVEKVFDSMHLEPEMLEKAIEAIRSSASAEQGHYEEIIKGLQAENTKIQSRLNRLTDLFLDGEFDENEYRKKRKSLEQKRDEIVKEIESNNRADNNFTEVLISALKLASEAGKTFRGSTVEQKRKLINLVFDNLELNGQKLDFKLRPPFDAFVKTAETGEWRTLVYDFRTFSQIFLNSTIAVFLINPEKFLGS